MIKLRKAAARGFADHGWLRTYHSFSFADYYDPEQMGFRTLRVINEDFVAGGGGFPMHGHRDMEIITYVIDGVLEHKDSHGNSLLIHPGEVQRMSAGTGVRNSEFNHSPDQPVHLLQIWILPRKNGLKFSYKQKSFVKLMQEQKLVLIASGEPREGAVSIAQDVDVFSGHVRAQESLQYAAMADRGLWLQMIKGCGQVDGFDVSAGDGLAMTDTSKFQFSATEDSEFLLFDLA